MLIGILSTCLLLGIFLIFIQRSAALQLADISKKYIYLAFVLKLLAAIFLWLVYTYYYTERASADIYKYFDDAQHIFNSTPSNLKLRYECFLGNDHITAVEEILATTNFWYSHKELFFNDNQTITRIHLILLIFSRGFYGFHILFFAILSMIGSLGLFKFFESNSKIPKSILYLVSFLLPSILFWTSAPLKENLLLFSLGLFLWGLSSIRKKFSASYFLYLLIGLLGLVSIKVYFLIALLPAAFLIGNKSLSKKASFIWFGIIHFVLFLFTCFISVSIFKIISNKQQQFLELAEISQAKSFIPINQFSTFWKMLLTIPQALYNVAIRPIFPPNWNPFTLMASLEHIVYVGILILPLLFFKKPKSINLFLFCASFVFLTFTLIGLTTPILGAIVRYKAPLLPFYLIAIFTFVDFSKISTKIK